MVSPLKRDGLGHTDDERVQVYVKKYDIWEIARKLVELENSYEKTLRLRLVKGKIR